jgi:hypothetical protein
VLTHTHTRRHGWEEMVRATESPSLLPRTRCGRATCRSRCVTSPPTGLRLLYWCSRASPPHISREDGLVHPADTSRSNLAAALGLLSNPKLTPGGKGSGVPLKWCASQRTALLLLAVWLTLSLQSRWVEASSDGDGEGNTTHATHSAASLRLRVRAQEGRAISPILFGAFFEELSHAGEGGLYAELVANPRFDLGASCRHRPSPLLCSLLTPHLYAWGSPPHEGYSDEKVANRTLVGSVSRRPRIPLYRIVALTQVLHARRESLGFVSRSRTSFCRAVPQP